MAGLSIGTRVKMRSGVVATVKSLLGEGGQGFVYLVDYAGQKKALKWYKPEFLAAVNAKKFYDNIINNIALGAPTSSFLWMEDATCWGGSAKDSYGYIMDVRPSNYQELTQFYLAHVTFPSDVQLLTACIYIIDAFRVLHSKGYSYQDINNGNFFIDKDTGRVLICDNDNVSENEANYGIRGRQRYMAPEVVMGANPNKYSDRFSMAVVLFRMLFWGHPLEGVYTKNSSMSAAEVKRFYGRDPVFLFDPVDKRNAPAAYLNKTAMQLWPMYPAYLQKLFIETFNKKDAKSAERRPIDAAWLDAFIRLRSELTSCPRCKTEVQLDTTKEVRCSHCGESLKAPVYLKNNRFKIPIVPGCVLYQCYFQTTNADYTKIIGKVLRNSTTNRVGFANMTTSVWTVYYTDGEKKTVGYKEMAPIKLKMKIEINNEICELV